ncbi:MAG: hypothetical protein V7K41_20020 [Nostoc sp.]
MVKRKKLSLLYPEASSQISADIRVCDRSFNETAIASPTLEKRSLS